MHLFENVSSLLEGFNIAGEGLLMVRAAKVSAPVRPPPPAPLRGPDRAPALRPLSGQARHRVSESVLQTRCASTLGLSHSLMRNIQFRWRVYSERN